MSIVDEHMASEFVRMEEEIVKYIEKLELDDDQIGRHLVQVVKRGLEDTQEDIENGLVDYLRQTANGQIEEYKSVVNSELERVRAEREVK